MSISPGGRNLLLPLVAASSSWVAFTSHHSSLVTLCLLFCKKLLLRPRLCSSPRGLSLLSFVYCLLDLSGAHLTGTEHVLMLLPNMNDDHQFPMLYNQTKNILSDFTLESLFALLLENPTQYQIQPINYDYAKIGSFSKQFKPGSIAPLVSSYTTVAEA
ncbi:hypothetical protein BHM03_00011593 [Ensete ventricosum]|nr:hypothetical protein BHM03_00011593 [Ensete ventricosum]